MNWKSKLFNLYFILKVSDLFCLFSFEYCKLFKSKHHRKQESVRKFKAFRLSIYVKGKKVRIFVDFMICLFQGLWRFTSYILPYDLVWNHNKNRQLNRNWRPNSLSNMAARNHVHSWRSDFWFRIYFLTFCWVSELVGSTKFQKWEVKKSIFLRNCSAHQPNLA